MEKMQMWFTFHPDATIVRFPQETAWKGYLPRYGTDIRFDYVRAIKFIYLNPALYSGCVVFLDYGGSTLYAEHKKLMKARLPLISVVELDPTTINYGDVSVEDAREILLKCPPVRGL
jgi:hypothetical protein